MTTTRLAVAGAAVAAAAGLWIGVRSDPGDEATTRASSAPSGDEASPTPTPPRRDAGDVRLRRIAVSSRAELVREVAKLGFDKVMVLTIGRPVKLEHYATDHLHLRMTYETPTGEVRLFQSNDQGITAGASVVIRGHEGVRNGEGASWVEGDYILDLNPLKRHYVRALRWVPTARRDA